MTIYPTISDYVATLENPTGVFRTLGEGCPDGIVAVERDLYGAPALRAGNSAAVFTYLRAASGENGSRGPSDKSGVRPLERRFLKCYIRPNPHLHTIYDYIQRTRPELLREVRLLRAELFVMPLAGQARWVDVVEGAWKDGVTLDVALARAGFPERSGAHASRAVGPSKAAKVSGAWGSFESSGSATRRRLAAGFERLCEALRAEEWAHGDLKPENIVVHEAVRMGLSGDREAGRAGRGAADSDCERTGDDSVADGVRMSLVDCDAMWVPELAGQLAVELGTPGFRDPARTPDRFDKSIDDYAIAAIRDLLRA